MGVVELAPAFPTGQFKAKPESSPGYGLVVFQRLGDVLTENLGRCLGRRRFNIEEVVL